MKKKKKSFRNPLATKAARRSAGSMRSKKNKRKNGKNKQKEFQNEDY